jgi:hypothetical protein
VNDRPKTDVLATYPSDAERLRAIALLAQPLASSSLVISHVAYAIVSIADGTKTPQEAFARLQVDSAGWLDKSAPQTALDESREGLPALSAAGGSTDYTRYEPGPNEDGRVALWCTDCSPAFGPGAGLIWVIPHTQVTPLSLANLIAEADAHEQQHRRAPVESDGAQ